METREEALIKESLATAREIRCGTSTRGQDATTAAVRSAIEKAFLIRRLKSQYQTTGFLALPADRYLQKLARQASLEISPLVTSFCKPGSFALAGWIGLAQAIEARLEHLEFWVRAWFAQDWQTDQVAAQLSNRSLKEGIRESMGDLAFPSDPQAAAIALRKLESQYSPDQKRRLAEALDYVA